MRDRSPGGLAVAFIVFGLASCAPLRDGSAPTIYVGTERYQIDRIVRDAPVDASAAVRGERITRLAHGSLHLVQVRTAEQPHRHAAHDLIVTVVEGKGVLHVDGDAVELRAGDVAAIGRGTRHWFANTGRRPAVAVVTFMPPVDEPDGAPVDSPREGR